MVEFKWITNGRIMKRRKEVIKMSELQMGTNESRFADIVWENEPVTTADLVKFGEETFNWKKTTTYTVLKRLCNKGIFKMEKSIVTSLMSRDEFYAKRSEIIVKEEFEGSLPLFLSAFSSRNKLTAEEVAKLREMIDNYEE